MQRSVTYEDSDVAKGLDLIIKHENKQEFIKLLTPMICAYHPAVDHMFKLLIGHKLPEVFPIGALCKIKVEQLGYGANKDLITARFADTDDTIVVTVKEFRGYHEWAPYVCEYTNVYEDGSTSKERAYIQSNELELIKEL